MPTRAMLKLGSTILEARTTARPTDRNARPTKPTQEWLGQKVNRKPQQLSTYEKGTKTPDLPLLAEIYAALKPAHQHEDSRLGPFTSWVALWMATQGPADSAVRMLLDEAAEATARPDPRARRQRKPEARAASPFTTLAELPRDDDVTVILGDRRETNTKMSAADCLIYSGSMIDSMFLPDLADRLPYFRIKSDKIFVKMRKKLHDMPEVANSHLLVIGSPAANWGARLLNEHAVFPFRIDPKAVEASNKMIDTGALQNHEVAQIFLRLTQIAPKDRESDLKRLRASSQKTEREMADLIEEYLPHSTGKDVMNKFKTEGFLDPADQENYGTQGHDANDFAVVTMARNPWSTSGHRAIMCAGKHGPGTAGAVRELLTRPSTFDSRPLGAVFEVGLDQALDWPSRFEETSMTAETDEYSVEQVLKNLERAVSESPDRLPPVYRDYWNSPTPAQTRHAVRTLLGLVGDEGPVM